MNLYQISHGFEEELDAFDALLNNQWAQNEDGDYITEDGEIITPDEFQTMVENRFAALDAMEQDVEKKAENVAAFIKNLNADMVEIETEEKRLHARRKAKENTVKRLKDYLLNCMTAVNRKKIDMPRAVISIRSNAESVSITDPERFIEWAQKNDRDDLLKYADPEIRKSAVKSELKDGSKIPFAQIIRTQSVIIK